MPSASLERGQGQATVHRAWHRHPRVASSSIELSRSSLARGTLRMSLDRCTIAAHIRSDHMPQDNTLSIFAQSRPILRSVAHHQDVNSVGCQWQRARIWTKGAFSGRPLACEVPLAPRFLQTKASFHCRREALFHCHVHSEQSHLANADTDDRRLHSLY